MNNILCGLCNKVEAPLNLITKENDETALSFGVIPICVYCADMVSSFDDRDKEILRFVAIDYRDEYFIGLREKKMQYIHNLLRNKMPLVDEVTKLIIEYDEYFRIYKVSNTLGKTKTFKSVKWLTLFIYQELDKIFC